MDDDSRRKKRARVSVACQECRNRKTRCDGQRPSCKRCDEVGITCSYDQPTTDGSAQRPTGFHLLSRLQALERKLQSVPEIPNITGQAVASSADAMSEFYVDLEDYADRPSVTPTSIPDEKPADQDNVDGMGAITLSESGDYCTYFGWGEAFWIFLDLASHVAGSSSNLALVRELSLALTSISNSRQSGRSYPRDMSKSRFSGAEAPNNRRISMSFTTSRPVSSLRVASNVQHLPAEPEAAALLRQYFNTVGLFFPCIDQDSFLATYKDFRRNGPRHVRRSWLALLYMIFADTYQLRSYSSPSDSTMEGSQKYFDKALELAMPEAITYSDLETVQFLCLMTSHLQGSTNSAQAWTFHVLSVKAAMQIGLHSTETYNKLSLLQRETRRRTWFWCVVNDSLLSVTLGRPPFVSNSLTKIDLPADISDFFPTSNQNQTLLTASLMYYNSMIRLSRLISDILNQLYCDNVAPPKDQSVFETLRLAFNFSWRLSEWLRSVPIDIRPLDTAPDPPMDSRSIQMRRFQTGLSIRYYGACALLHRSVLVKFLHFEPDHGDAAADLPLLRDSGMSFIRKSIHICGRSIALAKAIVAEPMNERLLWGAWWMTNFLTFNASLTHFGTLLLAANPSFGDLLTPEDITLIRADLQDAGLVFSRLNNANNQPIISRCRDCLFDFLELYDSLKAPAVSNSTPRPLGSNESPQQVDSEGTCPSHTEASLSVENQVADFSWCDMDFFSEPLAAGFATSDLEFLNGI